MYAIRVYVFTCTHNFIHAIPIPLFFIKLPYSELVSCPYQNLSTHLCDLV
ncbi:acyl-CoA-binding protein [Iris pallida]|uniref:Acyl-CoA-binding protein n=1 Tax=Iris pallida TaxID=29817 RepID=A0AAX6EEZ0_IRIPA|nr:acyl-CoA-binding protein [Iris pallida]